MSDLAEYRPASPAATRPDSPRTPGLPGPDRKAPGGWREKAVGWLGSRFAALGSPGSGDPAIERLAEIAAQAREPDEVRVALVRLASEISKAARVELFRERSGRSSRRLASWPPNAMFEPTVETGSGPRGPIALAISRARGSRATPSTLSQSLKAGEVHFGTLRLTSSGPRSWPAGTIRRLRTLCAIAASAERALMIPSRSESEILVDPEFGPQGSTILGAFLAFAHAQARRRREPLSLLEVAVDRLTALRELLGDELAETAIDRVSRAIKATVRASDVITRLEDGRLAVLLPNASAENAMKVAEAIRSAVARAGAASTTMPALTASIGVATFPNHAQDLATLRAAASTALTQAESAGHDQVAEALAIESPSMAPMGQLAG